ncbi:GIY-YIG nuclease family protein [Priestia megaterium]|uniref:GIY-YIG nuclease family protein n=1 Tax=Priestia megaterium TaxID=1404 RepID=UPI000C9A2FA1|nr:GIY-YIG nuclease family protein [Priestia megaterium]MQR88008.1 hypothetical protein [Priestia megaterium]PNE04620.1 hypothetical protein C1Y47_24945 [Priestia megaterium]
MYKQSQNSQKLFPNRQRNNKGIFYNFYLNGIKRSTKAVYVLWKEKECLYVGRSIDLRRRLLEHLRDDYKGFAKDITHIQFYIEENENARTYLEDSLIHRLKPVYNEREPYNLRKVSFKLIFREEEL